MALLALPLFVLLAIVLSLGLGLFLAALNVKYRDFRYVVPFIVQVGLFVSPIAFTTADVPERWRADLLRSTRWSASSTASAGRSSGPQSPLAIESVLATVVISVVVTAAAIWYFRRMERGFADVI